MAAHGYCDIDYFNDNDTRRCTFSELCPAGQFRIIIQILITPFVAVASTLTMTTIVLVKCIQTPHTYMLFAIAVADFIIGVVACPLYLLKLLPETGELVGSNRWVCLGIFWFRLSMDTLTFDLFSLMCIDRFVKIWYPIWYIKNMSKRRILGAISACITFRVVILISLIALNLDYTEWSAKECLTNDLLSPNTMFTLMNVILYVEVSMAFASCVMVVVKALLRKHNKARRSAHEYRKYTEAKFNAILVSSLMFVFLALWLPSLVVFQVLGPKNTSYVAHDLVRMTCFFNSIMNAVVYAATREVFRSCFKFLLTTPPWRWRELPKWRKRQEEATNAVDEFYAATMSEKTTSTWSHSYKRRLTCCGCGGGWWCSCSAVNSNNTRNIEIEEASSSSSSLGEYRMSFSVSGKQSTSEETPQTGLTPAPIRRCTSVDTQQDDQE